MIEAAAHISGPQQLDVSKIDLRFSSLRLSSPREFRRLQSSVHSEGRIRDPLLVSTAVQAQRWVLVDGFKRLRVAEELGLSHVWVQAVQLDAAHAKAAILQCNQPRQGVCELEEAWIVHSLCREHGMKQTQVAALLKRGKSWVCRRLKLAEALEEPLQQDVRLGLLSPTTACELAQLQRCNQQQVAQAVREHELTTRQSERLVDRLRQTCDPQAMREVLADPLRYIALENGAERASEDDPRLSEDGNRLRRMLLSWQSFCGKITHDLRGQPAPADAHVLAEVLQDAVHSAERVLRQLEAVHRACSSQQPPPQATVEPPTAPGQGAPDA